MYEFLLFLSVMIFVACTILYVKHPAASILHPVTIYLAFHGLVYTVRPITAYIYDYRTIYWAVGFTPSAWEKSVVLICTNLALVVFVAVALKVAPQPLIFRQTIADTLRRQSLLKYFWLVAIPVGAAGIYSLYWRWGLEATSGTLGATDQRYGFRAMEATTGYFLILGSMLAPLVAIYAYLHRFRLVSLLPFAAFSVLKLGTGGRGDFIAAAAMLLVLYLYERGRKWPDWRTVAGALAALFVFSMVVQDRGAGVRELFGTEGINESRVGGNEGRFSKPLEHMDFANLESFEFVVYAVPGRTGSFDYFLHNLRILTEPIPRALWKDKPMGEPVRLFYLYDHGNYIAMALGVPAVGWYSLGYIGVVMWAALFAWFYTICYRQFSRGKQGHFAVLGYAILLSTSFVAFRDGMILTILTLSLPYFAPLVLMLILVRLLAPELLQPAMPQMTRSNPGQPRDRAVPRSRRRSLDQVVPRARRKRTS